jgi:hypothetical protein
MTARSALHRLPPAVAEELDFQNARKVASIDGEFEFLKVDAMGGWSRND